MVLIQYRTYLMTDKKTDVVWSADCNDFNPTEYFVIGPNDHRLYVLGLYETCEIRGITSLDIITTEGIFYDE